MASSGTHSKDPLIPLNMRNLVCTRARNPALRLDNTLAKHVQLSTIYTVDAPLAPLLIELEEKFLSYH